MRSILLILGSLSLLGACSYTVPAKIAPSYSVQSNYDEKMDYRIALMIDSSELSEDVKVRGFACSAHVYPVDARSAFKTSVIKTFENLVREVEAVDQGLARDDLVQQGYDAMVYVEAEEMDIALYVIPGFWTAEMEADAEIVASVRAETATGRALGSTVEGDGDAKADAGGACEGGAQAISGAMADAIEETMQRLGERLSNSERLREMAPLTS